MTNEKDINNRIKYDDIENVGRECIWQFVQNSFVLFCALQKEANSEFVSEENLCLQELET